MAPSRLGVVSASGRSTGLATTIGVSGCPWRTMSRKARVISSIMPALWGVRVQQLVPWVIEITSADSPATASAQGISPRAEPA